MDTKPSYSIFLQSPDQESSTPYELQEQVSETKKKTILNWIYKKRRAGLKNCTFNKPSRSRAKNSSSNLSTRTASPLSFFDEESFLVKRDIGQAFLYSRDHKPTKSCKINILEGFLDDF